MVLGKWSRQTLLVLAALFLAGCGSHSRSTPPNPSPHTTMLSNGLVRYYFGSMSIDVPSDWTSYDPSHPGCVNLAAGSTIVFDNAGNGVCPEIARADANKYVHLIVSAQPTEPVLTTIMGMTISNEPLNGFEAQHLHLGEVTDIDEQSIYIPKLKVDIGVQQPKSGTLAAQVLNTVAAR